MVFSIVRKTKPDWWSKRYTWGSDPPDTVHDPSVPPPYPHAWGRLAGPKILNTEKSVGEGLSLASTPPDEPKGGAYFVSLRASTAAPVMPALSPSLEAMISTPFIVPGMA